ncbi:hypothetical protein H9X85_10190 [Anaerotignum lactatifermentans]|uniref:Uncharacterized protein n=1 Tax=Anaerotignum lactatifermentans TaxID=160404 RepID=A0ABS2GCQ2_9FIRM|nr:hypothetical protein [Anaerotignum lactatifermentans]MBM6829910.1 hypothetical protein [Anaerotignum lactatifermentans]MBM6878413.1 hypothetical protein [Anaerotignum lactatifermentans]MBM6951567.1 hypothetical protein [Anaerotignum lactatifermentans]
MQLPENGRVLYQKYKKFQKISIVLLLAAAISFVFLHNWLLMVAFVVLDFFLETKTYVCPHCGKKLDCRRKLQEDTTCPGCQKYLFKGL